MFAQRYDVKSSFVEANILDRLQWSPAKLDGMQTYNFVINCFFNQIINQVRHQTCLIQTKKMKQIFCEDKKNKN